jgi:hypothetical protein
MKEKLFRQLLDFMTILLFILLPSINMDGMMHSVNILQQTSRYFPNIVVYTALWNTHQDSVVEFRLQKWRSPKGEIK